MKTLITLVVIALALQQGSSTDLCDELPARQNRGKTILPVPSPHAFKVSRNTVGPGSIIDVEIISHDSDNPFEQVFIQARNQKGSSVGKFVETGTGVKTIDCNGNGEGDAVTNSNFFEKVRVQAKWRAPDDVDEETEIHFYYSIGKDSNTKWPEQESSDVELTSNSLNLSSNLVMIFVTLLGSRLLQ